MDTKEYVLDADKFSKLFDENYDPSEVTPREKMEIPVPVMEVYFNAANLYLIDNMFPEAKDAFTFLTFLDPYIHEHWVGLGIANQSMENYEDAIKAYNVAEATELEDPIPYANAYQCARAIQDDQLAQASLEKARQYSEGKEEFAELRTNLEQIVSSEASK